MHGGKREGAGRPKGAVCAAAHELRAKAREHTQEALDAIIEILGDALHPQRLKAAEIVLERGYGRSITDSPAEAIIGRFLSYEISAVKAGLLLEAADLKVGVLMQKHIDREIQRFDDQNKTSFLDAPHLPRE